VSQVEVKACLGWLDSPEKARALIPVYKSFEDEIHKAGVDRVLVLGMGGSSLIAEVLSSLLAAAKIDAPLSLAILDSTDPTQVAQAAQDYSPDKSLYIVASKSGDTAEMLAAFDYFWGLSKGDGSRFIAITDPGTSLEKLAREHSFRKIFSSDETVGGRFAALTDFGLVPAALLGMDLSRLLDRVDWMKKQCLALNGTARNPAMVLAAVVAESALAGRDKLTVQADASLSALAGWIEQIIAESSGKFGKGILPVPLEPMGDVKDYGKDRMFVYLRQTGELDEKMKSLHEAGHPVLEFTIADPYEAGAEFYRWEIATSIACHILGVNAFDQPDVQDSKDRTRKKIAEFQQSGKLAETDLGIGVKESKKLLAFIGQAKAGDYIALNVYLPRNGETIAALQGMRLAIRARTGCAVTAGFGPRFQHSTGQFHKGGPANGLFIQIIADIERDMDIPGEGLTFGTLIRAQALGDYETLVARERRVMRVRLSSAKELPLLVKSLSGK
jgi:transaldolase/glucose-6-phosphate isomerase